MIHTTKKLIELDNLYNEDHGVTTFDVEKANRLSLAIEADRDPQQPRTGDRVIYTDEYGRLYDWGLFEAHTYGRGNASICQHAYTPFVHIAHNGEVRLSVSGGSFDSITPEEMKQFKLIKQAPSLFCDWGHSGACANGAFNFEAMVNVWEYTKPQLYKFTSQKGFLMTLLNGNDKFYTTKTPLKVCLRQTHLNDTFLAVIKKETGLEFEKAFSGFYWAVPSDPMQIVQLIIRLGDWSFNYYDNATHETELYFFKGQG